MDRKAYRAQETRWRFVTVRTKSGEHHTLELADRTAARAFATWLASTGAIRRVEITDKNYCEGGEAWADPT